MTEKKQMILEKAIETCGSDHQLKMCLEEMSELQKEICKAWRNRGDVEAIAEEVADVLITLDQLMLIYQIRDKVDGYYVQKMLRLDERLKEGNYE